MVGSAQAADIWINSYGTVRLDGWIVGGDDAKFAQTTKGYPPGTYVSLSGHGGNLGVALDIGDIISRARIFHASGRQEWAV
jgi:hypothetical protein